jgi:iron complex transport system substrate-binding protein
MPAVLSGRLHEIKSCDILQPGPAALTDGLAQLHGLLSNWAAEQAPSLPSDAQVPFVAPT